MRVPLGMPRDSCAAARSAAAEISSCSLAERKGTVERAVVQPASRPTQSKAAGSNAIFCMALHNAAPAPGKPLLILQNIAKQDEDCVKRFVTALSFLWRPRRQSAPYANKPREIADGACSIFCPTSGRTLVMGFHPLFRFNCRRRSGSLFRALAPHQAKPGLFSGGVSSI